MTDGSKKNTNLDELVRKAAQGQEAAFSELYDLYFDKIYRFVYFRVNHREQAQDLVSETFIKVWGRLRDMEDFSSFNSWLFQIARNLVIDYYRTKKIQVDLNLLENVLIYEDDLVNRTDVSLQEKIFLEALKKLNPDQQVVIKLKFIEDLENAEIAKILDKTEGAVRVIQHRAIKELKNLLSNQDAN